MAVRLLIRFVKPNPLSPPVFVFELEKTIKYSLNILQGSSCQIILEDLIQSAQTRLHPKKCQDKIPKANIPEIIPIFYPKVQTTRTII